MRLLLHSAKAMFLFFCLTLLGCKNEPLPKTGGTVTGNFPQVAYTKVVAYHYDDQENMGKIIDRQGKLNPNIIKQTTLKTEQVNMLVELLNNRDTYSTESARCFHPRLGVVFYDDKETAVGHLSVCFQCNNYASHPQIPATGEGMEKLAGFSILGRKQLQDFCKSLGFGDC
jgi:hypothetical protein